MKIIKDPSKIIDNVSTVTPNINNSSNKLKKFLKKILKK